MLDSFPVLSWCRDLWASLREYISFSLRNVKNHLQLSLRMDHNKSEMQLKTQLSVCVLTFLLFQNSETLEERTKQPVSYQSSLFFQCRGCNFHQVCKYIKLFLCSNKKIHSKKSNTKSFWGGNKSCLHSEGAVLDHLSCCHLKEIFCRTKTQNQTIFIASRQKIMA